MNLKGLHHVTAITGNPQRNIDFYTGVLGLRLVKKTVNFDDPSSYHLYYGDEVGSPGTILTFFSWADSGPGRVGMGQASRISLGVPKHALSFWIERLSKQNVKVDGPTTRFGEETIGFADPDGMALELVATDEFKCDRPWISGSITKENAIQGLYGVTLPSPDPAISAKFLVATMGATELGQEGAFHRFSMGEGPTRAMVDLFLADGTASRSGAGAIHHVAWETPGDEEQAAWLKKLSDYGFRTSQVMDRTYFHSIYYREPGHVLFEIATSHPGFAVDEEVEKLGEKLMLPPWLENQRALVESSLTPVRKGDSHL